MSVDTEDKRRSVTNIHPVSDGVIGMSDRANVTGFYSGLNYTTRDNITISGINVATGEFIIIQGKFVIT